MRTLRKFIARISVLAFLALAPLLPAQGPQTPPPAMPHPIRPASDASSINGTALSGPPALSATTQLALQAIRKSYQEHIQAVQADQQNLRAVEADIVKDHPGYHLDEATFTLQANGAQAPTPGAKADHPAAKAALPDASAPKP